jgi:predicted RNA-binding Zn-ribbon protein involved in translation (DUF1610 family)
MTATEPRRCPKCGGARFLRCCEAIDKSNPMIVRELDLYHCTDCGHEEKVKLNEK